jgi:phage terminase Nu1 subunit (DNA packaging protein)
MKTRMSEGVSLREFGRLVGVSGEAIRKAIKTGRIPAHLVGEAELSSGRKVPIIRDADGARVAFTGNTNPVHRQDGARISAGKRSAKAAARGDAAAAEHHRQALSDTPPVPAPAQRADSGVLPAITDGVLPSITESRQVTEAYKARLTRLEFEEKSGKLVDADEFRTKFTTMVATARTRLLGVPSKAKGRIPHLTVDEISVLAELRRDALEEAAGAR